MKKRVFDVVEPTTLILSLLIAALVCDFAKAEGKLRLETVADNVAERLVELGVETYGDVRFATCSMYVNNCDVKKIDTGRLVLS